MAHAKSIGRPWIHHGVKCDDCGTLPITGLRLKCQTCADHDMCLRCFTKRETGGDKTGCKFLKIEVDSSKFYPPFQIRYYGCDACQAVPIQGLRYHHNVRSNYNLCGDCFAKSSESAGTFREIEETKIDTLCQSHSPVYHFHKQCISCGQRPIAGPRFDSIQHAVAGVPRGKDQSLCLTCFDLKFTKKALKSSDYERVERPEVDHVIHLAMFCCFQCGETPICGPAYVNTRLPNESLCLLCYQHMDPSRWQYHYNRVEPPCQFGDPLLTTAPDNGGLAERLEAFKLSSANTNTNSTSNPPGKKTGDEDIDKLDSRLNSAVVEEKPNVKWDDVAGLDSAKQALQEAVVFPIKYPQFFEGDRKPWNAFLLYGPPGSAGITIGLHAVEEISGTGKSYLAKAVATEVDSTFFSISASDLGSKWTGESEKLVSQLFQKARKAAPSIIFIDEIDSIAGTRSENDVTAVKTEILVQMQGVGNNNDKVLVLAATNLPYNLDQALRRRFDKRIYIPLPEQSARSEMFKIHLKKTPHSLTDIDFEDLASRTPGYSGSDISVCVKDVLWAPLRKIQTAKYFRMDRSNWYPCEPYDPGAVKITMKELEAKNLASKIKLPPIARVDFDKTLAKQRPTVSQDDLKLHLKFTQEFGEEGTTTGGERGVQHGSEWNDKLESGLDLSIRKDMPNVRWSDVSGLDSVKQALYEAVVLPLKHPQFLIENRMPWTSFLIYGPSGAGKTYLVQAVATQVDSFFSTSGRDLATMGRDQSEKLIYALFHKARKCAPSVVFIDDVDVISAQLVDTNNHELTQMLLKALGSKNEKVVILAATNLPYTLDPVVRQCFEKRIHIPFPDHTARKEMFKVHLGRTPHWLTDQDFDEFAWRTSGFSGADISVCVRSASLEPIRRLEAARFFKQVYSSDPATVGQQIWTPCHQYDSGAYSTTLKGLVSQGWGDKIQPQPVVKADLDIAIVRSTPTVRQEDLDVYLRFSQEFGKSG